MIYIQRFSQQCPLYLAPLPCRPHLRVQSYRGLVPLVILCVLLTPCAGGGNSLLRCESVSACLRPPAGDLGLRQSHALKREQRWVWAEGPGLLCLLISPHHPALVSFGQRSG